MDLGEICKFSQLGLKTIFGASMSQNQQLWWQQYCGFFVKIKLAKNCSSAQKLIVQNVYTANCATDKQFSSNTSDNITVLQQMIIGNAVRLTAVLVNLMTVKVATKTLAVKLKNTHNLEQVIGNRPARAAAQGRSFPGRWASRQRHTPSHWRGAACLAA